MDVVCAGTEALYYKNTREENFSASLVEQRANGKEWIAVLDRTAFYPEGGGQPADHGSLNNIEVLDVQKEDNEILHFLPKKIEGSKVQGKIDLAFRYDYMQQHTGQHLISAALYKKGNYKTVSSYLGRSYTAVEIDVADISEKQVFEVEELCNLIISRNLPVISHWVSSEQAARFPLRKPVPDREKIRLIEIEDFDFVGCGGMHLDHTGEIQIIKAVGREKIRGRLRLHWQIGKRAFNDYRNKHRTVTDLSKELTCSGEDLLTGVIKIKEELRSQKQSNAVLQGRLARYITDSMLAAAKDISGLKVVLHLFNNEDPELVKKIFNDLLESGQTAACLVNNCSGRLQWHAGNSENAGLPLKDIIPPLLPLIDARGGGKGNRWQGIGRDITGVQNFLKRVEQNILENKNKAFK